MAAFGRERVLCSLAMTVVVLVADMVAHNGIPEKGNGRVLDTMKNIYRPCVEICRCGVPRTDALLTQYRGGS